MSIEMESRTVSMPSFSVAGTERCAPFCNESTSTCLKGDGYGVLSPSP